MQIFSMTRLTCPYLSAQKIKIMIASYGHISQSGHNLRIPKDLKHVIKLDRVKSSVHLIIEKYAL